MFFSPNILSQRDPRWVDEPLGFDGTLTIGTHGDALTCLTMLVNGFGFHETPASLNQKLKDIGNGVGFLGGLIVWPGLTSIFPGISFQRIAVCRDSPAPLAEINSSLEVGQPLLIEIDHSPSPGLQNLWVLIYARQGHDYLMLDPYPQPPDGSPVGLVDRYGFGREPAEFITTVAWYAAQPGPESAPVPASLVDLYVHARAGGPDGLILSSAPDNSASTLAVEPPGTLLSCLEPDAVARPKIGVSDLWMKVRDPVGLVGYVAAWYVEIDTSSAPAPMTIPAPVPVSSPPASMAPAVLTVLVAKKIGAVGLRLRDQPDANANTLGILSAGMILTVLEPPDQARRKLGQAGQWINLRTLSGLTGYAAAGFIEPADSAFADSLPSSASSPAILTVIVSSQVASGLRLRAAPDTSATILKILNPGTPLTVLEPAGLARAKVGMNDQWLNVKELGGATGYVAALYVTA